MSTQIELSKVIKYDTFFVFSGSIFSFLVVEYENIGWNIHQYDVIIYNHIENIDNMGGHINFPPFPFFKQHLVLYIG